MPHFIIRTGPELGTEEDEAPPTDRVDPFLFEAWPDLAWALPLESFAEDVAPDGYRVPSEVWARQRSTWEDCGFTLWADGELEHPRD